MGYDITFHPVTRDELQQYVFDIVLNPALAEQRALQITHLPEKVERIRGIYSSFDAWKAEVASGKSSFNGTFAYAAAQISSYLHPHWYARNACLTFLGRKVSGVRAFLKSIRDLSPESFPGIRDSSGGQICWNGEGGGYVERARISGLRAFLTDPRRIWKIVEEMSVEGLQSLLETIEYCERHEAGFMEAADVAIPLIEATSGDPDHFNPPVSTVDLDALLEKAETPRPRRRLWSIVKDLFHRRKGRPRFKGEWIRSYEKEREFWDGSHDLFRDLDKIVRFAMAVEHGLTFALDALYLERRELSQAVLRQTVDAADRILGERLWDSDRCEEPRPENLGEILRCRSYAEALLTGSLDLANLRQALELLEPALKGKSPADEYDQAGFLAVIRLHLICGAADRAIQLLNRWEKLMWIRSDQLDALLAAVDGRLEAFDAFFDRWRAPRPPSEPFENPQMLRLELGILREQYLTHRGEPLSWDRVISEIAR